MIEYVAKEDVMNAIERGYEEYVMMRNILHSPLDYIRHELGKIPTADVENVVHCKDCRFAQLFVMDAFGVKYNCIYYGLCDDRIVDENEYCACGERMENAR